MKDGFPEKLSDWLLERLEESRLRDIIPRSSLKEICDRVSTYYLTDNVFDTSVLIDWLVSDYGLERAEVVAQIRRLQARQSEVGVEIYILEEWDPDEASAFDESWDEDPEAAEAPDRGLKNAADPAAAHQAFTTVYIKTMARPKAKKKRGEEVKIEVRPPDQVSTRMAVSEAEGEKIFRAYALEGKTPPDEDLEKILSRYFVLNEIEQAYYRGLSTSILDGEVAGWALQVNGNALAYEHAAFLADQEEVSLRSRLGRAIKQLEADSLVFKAKVKVLLKRLERERSPLVFVIEPGLGRFSKGLAKIQFIRDKRLLG